MQKRIEFREKRMVVRTEEVKSLSCHFFNLRINHMHPMQVVTCAQINSHLFFMNHSKLQRNYSEFFKYKSLFGYIFNLVYCNICIMHIAFCIYRQQGSTLIFSTQECSFMLKLKAIRETRILYTHFIHENIMEIIDTKFTCLLISFANRIHSQ